MKHKSTLMTPKLSRNYHNVAQTKVTLVFLD